MQENVCIQVSVLEFEIQITPISYYRWAHFQSSAHTVLIVIMGWLHFIQIGEEESWRDSSL